MSLVSDFRAMASRNPGKNMEDNLRLMGLTRLRRNQARARLNPLLAGELHDLITGRPPILFAEPAAVRQVEWAKPLIEAGFIRTTDTPEPKEPTGDAAVRSPAIKTMLALVRSVTIDAEIRTVLDSVLDALLSDHAANRPSTADTLARLFAVIFTLEGGYADRNSAKANSATMLQMHETAVRALEGQFAAERRLIEQQTGQSFRPNGADEHLHS
jgi:hypothetical protein